MDSLSLSLSLHHWPLLLHTKKQSTKACSTVARPSAIAVPAIYAFWYADAEGKGHWKTVGRQSTKCSPKVASDERAKFLATFGATGINPIEQSKVTIGQAVDGYVRWGRSEGKYVDQHYFKKFSGMSRKTVSFMA